VAWRTWRARRNGGACQPLISIASLLGMQFKILHPLSACCVSHEQGIRSNLGRSQAASSRIACSPHYRCPMVKLN
jgi:hypothetical protein